MKLSKIQRTLYLGQRSIGDYRALQNGGVPRLGKRVGRRVIVRNLFRLLGNGRR